MASGEVGGISTGSPCPLPPQHGGVHTTLVPTQVGGGGTKEGQGKAAAGLAASS